MLEGAPAGRRALSVAVAVFAAAAAAVGAVGPAPTGLLQAPAWGPHAVIAWVLIAWLAAAAALSQWPGARSRAAARALAAVGILAAVGVMVARGRLPAMAWLAGDPAGLWGAAIRATPTGVTLTVVLLAMAILMVTREPVLRPGATALGLLGLLVPLSRLASGILSDLVDPVVGVFDAIGWPMALALAATGGAGVLMHPALGHAGTLLAPGPLGLSLRLGIAVAVAGSLAAGLSVLWMQTRSDWSDHDVASALTVVLGITLAPTFWHLLVRANRAAESAVRHLERFEVMFRDSPVAKLLVDPAGVVRDTNRAAEELLGWGREDLLGHPVERVVPAAIAAAHRDLRARYFAEARSRAMGSGRPVMARSREGEEIPVDIALTPLELGGERVVLATIRDLREHRRAERLGVEAERVSQRLRTLVAGLPQFVWPADAEGRLTEAALVEARAPFRGDEVGADELLGLDRDLAGEAAGALAYGRARDAEVVQGERVFLRRVTPYRDVNGLAAGVVVAYVDVTLLRRREQAVAEAERFVRTVADAIPAAVGYWTPALRCRFVNRAWLARRGRDAAAAHALELPKVLGEGAFAQVRPQVEGALAGAGQSFEQIDDEGGARRFTWVQYLPDHGPEGVRGFLALETDVTALRQREEELRGLKDRLEDLVRERTADLSASEGRFRALIEGIPQMTWLVARDGRTVYASPRMVEILGVPAEAAALDERVLHPEDAARYREAVAAAMAAGGGWREEARVRRRDGGWRWYLLNALPIHGDGGAVLQWVGTGTDIDDHRRLQARLQRHAAELQRSNAALEQFAYAASHDLQEPLRMVASYTQLIERRYAALLDDDGRRMMGFAVDGARRMQALINDLLAYARAGHPSEPGRTTDMRAALQRALDLLAAAMQREGAELRIDGDLPAVRADPAAMTQLWQNLLANALTHRGPEVPRLQVGCRDAGPSMTTCFLADNGVGIDPRHHQRIFQVFQRLDRGTAQRRPGTGIGLALCQRVVEAAGGRIWVESDGRSGSTFCFTLPLAGSDPPEGEGQWSN